MNPGDKRDALYGTYAFVDGAFMPRGDMPAINARLEAMSLLFDAGPGVPSFYVDATDGSFWEYVQDEDYSTALRRVDRSYIEATFPTVDPDRPIGTPPQTPSRDIQQR
ncbi:MAG TPA: hypothetical protein VKC59_07825 [Candidatus Limnocylindrales bacterium]|nr:hypothetical protein [Candidatus Limnocylindrales bacterium]